VSEDIEMPDRDNSDQDNLPGPPHQINESPQSGASLPKTGGEGSPRTLKQKEQTKENPPAKEESLQEEEEEEEEDDEGEDERLEDQSRERTDPLGLYAFAPNLEFTYRKIVVDDAAILAQFRLNIQDNFEQDGTIKVNLFRWMFRDAELAEMIYSEFDCYRWH